MEFFVVVLIFISCMVALALLIYYCQEYRNPKYSVSGNQKDISAIALAIAAPGFDFTAPQTAYSPGFTPYLLPMPPKMGFKQNVFRSRDFVLNKKGILNMNPSDNNSSDVKIQQGILQKVLVPPDSDSSSSSEQIYYSRRSTAYSVAKRMSVSANVEKTMSTLLANRVSPKMAAYITARRMSDTPLSANLATAKRTQFSTRAFSLPQKPNKRPPLQRTFSIDSSDSTSCCSSTSNSDAYEEPNSARNSSSVLLHTFSKDKRVLQRDHPLVQKPTPPKRRKSKNAHRYLNKRDNTEHAPPQRCENISFPLEYKPKPILTRKDPILDKKNLSQLEDNYKSSFPAYLVTVDEED